MPFSPPRDTNEKDKRWQAFAKPGLRDSRYLWKDYWQRFNAITIPLLDEDAFFADALAAAKEAQNREHLKELLGEKSNERRRELDKIVTEISYATVFDRNRCSSEAAWSAAYKVGGAGSLDSFVRSASGIVWGWGDGDKDNTPAEIAPPDGDNDRDDKRDVGGNHEGQPEEREFLEDDVTGTQDWPYSPCPNISNAWDLADHGLLWRASELQEIPGDRRLLLSTSLRAHDTALGAEGRESTDDVGRDSLEPPRKSSDSITGNRVSGSRHGVSAVSCNIAVDRPSFATSP